MKKLLLGSTALVAAGLVAGIGSPAQAAEPIQLSLGGYYAAFVVGIQQTDVLTGPHLPVTHLRPVIIMQEAEVHFKGETTLDNGIKVGAQIQLEAYSRQVGNGSTDQIDEHYVYFSGNFGRLVVGAENSAAYLMHYSAPGAVTHHGLDSPNFWGMIGETGNATGAGSPVATPVNLSSDANKITYFTPRFSPGFQFGFSYTPDDNNGGGRNGTGGNGNPFIDSDDAGHAHGNMVAVGVNFVRTIGSVDVAWSAGYEHGILEESSTVFEDNDQAATGFQIGVGGWTVGGAFQWSDQGTRAPDTDQFEIVGGVTYGAGPWVVGVQGAYGWDEDGALDTDTVLAGEVGGTYTLGPGVKVAAGVRGWTRDGGSDVGEIADADGVSVTVGTALSF